MTVEELIDELKAMPPTAMVFVEDFEDDDLAIEAVTYDLGRVVIKLQL